MNDTLISIVTVVYNGGEYLEKTIQSILNQTYDNVEYIVIDGGSTDRTLDIIKKYEDKIDYWISEKDSGIYDAMNKGIKLSQGNYLLFLNAGDIFSSKNVIEKVIKVIEQKNPSIIYGGANIYNANGVFLTYLRPLIFSKNNLNWYATRVVCHQSVFVKKEVIVLYDIQFKLKGELNWYYELLSKIDHKNQIINLDFPICNYSLGGVGDQKFWVNYIERLKVTYKHNTIFSFILNIPFYFIPLAFRLRRMIFGK
jgi:glycosyltransferase involved in cell wall biosynthesis